MTSRNASLVIGAHGVIGRAVSERLRILGHQVVEMTRRPTAGSLTFDLDALATSWAPPMDVTTAYFCAAVTSQAACHSAFAQAYAANVTNTVLLIRRLVDAGVFVVFPSTNLVFDGSTPRVSVKAARCPRTTYGRMKAEAETHLLALGEGVGVVRLTKVVHEHLPIFVEWRTSLTQGVSVHPFRDMVFSPLPLGDAVSVLVAVGEKGAHGITQASAQDDISYAHACDLLARQLGIAESRVQPVSWQEVDRRFEHVPEHTTLDTARAEELCGFAPPMARAALVEIFASSTAIQ